MKLPRTMLPPFIEANDDADNNTNSGAQETAFGQHTGDEKPLIQPKIIEPSSAPSPEEAVATQLLQSVLSFKPE